MNMAYFTFLYAFFGFPQVTDVSVSCRHSVPGPHSKKKRPLLPHLVKSLPLHLVVPTSSFGPHLPMISPFLAGAVEAMAMREKMIKSVRIGDGFGLYWGI